MTRLSRTLLMACAALGLGAASTSSYVHYRLLTDASYSSFCDISATVNCTQAYLSQYGSFWGIPVALFLTLLFLFGAGSAIAYFPSETPPQVATTFTALNAQQRAEIAKWWDLQPKTEVPLPADGAKVLVTIFSDYQCPHCRAAHETYRSLI